MDSMRFAQAHKASTYLMVAFAYLAMVSGGGISRGIALGGLVGLVGVVVVGAAAHPLREVDVGVDGRVAARARLRGARRDRDRRLSSASAPSS